MILFYQKIACNTMATDYGFRYDKCAKSEFSIKEWLSKSIRKILNAIK